MKATLRGQRMDVGTAKDVKMPLVDIDQDGQHEVITSSEGKTQRWACGDSRTENGGKYSPLAKRQWIVHGHGYRWKNGIDIVIGAKNKKANIGWYRHHKTL